MAETILKVENLITRFHSKDGAYPAVNGVSFELREGETLGIVGESGCGKSVTSLSILKLLPDRIGTIDKESSVMFKGEELTTKSNKEMCNIRGNEIAMIFQDSMTSLNPTMSIEKQMMEILIKHRKMNKNEARAYAVEMLKKVGIPSPEVRIRQFPHQLSGGMRQRVMIAMALSCDPAILIADEPTTALDVTVQAQILRMMKELQEKTGTAIMLITHDMGVVAEAADRVIVMYAGDVVEQATKDELFHHPKHPYTKGLLASIPKIGQKEEKLYTIEGMVPSLKNMPKGCRFCDRCPVRMEKCRENNPQLYQAGESTVRCFLYEKGAGKEEIL